MKTNEPRIGREHSKLLRRSRTGSSSDNADGLNRLDRKIGPLASIGRTAKRLLPNEPLDAARFAKLDRTERRDEADLGDLGSNKPALREDSSNSPLQTGDGSRTLCGTDLPQPTPHSTQQRTTAPHSGEKRSAGTSTGTAEASARGPADEAWEALSAQQRQIAQLTCEGFGDLAIATKLGISEFTVGNHLRAVFSRLGVHSRVELAWRLLSRGSVRTRFDGGESARGRSIKR